MNLSSEKKTIKYLKKTITKDQAYEFILYAVPLLYCIIERLDHKQLDMILSNQKLSKIYDFVIDIVESCEDQKNHKGTKE